ncbi:MFS general substrate transporter [Didymella exigua CBS 183.55]|uniref:MFS general substrate transporter n=1 Tax=Didymella exigua CBS 183.55 TaxID=1150837 RepID=A0A6A5RJ57_9PLEO|nr:MFS general substrate transporter [Didymella exigua CBS 183.55]KAF1927463.1 MFS general substrate transporter [Didymella exigua CBS 183.55]
MRKVRSRPDPKVEITTPTSPTTPPTAEAERHLRRKIDLYIIPIVAILYALCTIDRVNIGNARLAGLERTLGLKGNQYNALLSILFSIPASYVIKVLGPGWVLPGTTLIFGILTTSFAFTFKQAAAVRVLRGVFEAGIFGGCSYCVSRWYRRGAASGLLASGILKLDHFGSTKGWQMIFAIEGIITIGLALLALVLMTYSALLDDFDMRKALRGLWNPVVLLTSVSLGLVNITVQGISFFNPTVVRSIYPNRSVVAQQLYSVPHFVVGAFFTLLFSGLSWRLDRRNLIMMTGELISMLGYALVLGSDYTQTSLKYGAMSVGASGCFLFGSLMNAQISANVLSDTSRSSVVGLNTMMRNLGRLNVASLSIILIVLTLLGLRMKRDNRKRVEKQSQTDEALSGLRANEEQDSEYRYPSFRRRT